MNRTDLQQLAEERVRDAKALLDAACWSGAYYLVGYAVECGLKACIAKKTNLHDFPDKSTTLDAHTHNLSRLLDLSGLKDQLTLDASSNPALGVNWYRIKDWSERTRYRLTAEADARLLFQAVDDPLDGVLPWIRGFW